MLSIEITAVTMKTTYKDKVKENSLQPYAGLFVCLILSYYYLAYFHINSRIPKGINEDIFPFMLAILLVMKSLRVCLLISMASHVLIIDFAQVFGFLVVFTIHNFNKLHSVKISFVSSFE